MVRGGPASCPFNHLRSIYGELGPIPGPCRLVHRLLIENNVNTHIANLADLVLGLLQFSKCPTFTPEESQKNIHLNHPEIPVFWVFICGFTKGVHQAVSPQVGLKSTDNIKYVACCEKNPQ